MGYLKISLKDFSNVKRKFSESIDDYLNMLRLMKSICFTQVYDHELVKMASGGLDYYTRKKLVIQYLRDISQLEDRLDKSND